MHMEIKAVKFRKNGFYGQPFAFGGEEGMDKFDANIRYRGSLQNFTHKHANHSGCLKLFPNAKIYVGAEKIGVDELKDVLNLVPVHFTDGPYYNFPESQRIADGVYMVKAKGHTNGNSLAVAEKGGKFYMFQGKEKFNKA